MRAGLSFPCSPGIWSQTVPYQVKTSHLRSSQSLDVRTRNRLNHMLVSLTLKKKQSEPAPRCHRVTRRAGCQKATMELSLQNLQLLSHLHYPMDTHQLTSSQGEADGVSEREYDVAGVGGGEFALRLVPRQRAAPFYWRSRLHTHTHTQISLLTQLNHGICCFAKPCRHQDDEEKLYHGTGGFLTSMRGG